MISQYTVNGGWLTRSTFTSRVPFKSGVFHLAGNLPEFFSLIGPFNNMGLEMLSSMFGGLGTGSLSVPNRSNEPPEQLYATQLSQLQEMGFFDTQENIRALIATSGNVHAAVERLLGNSGGQ
ncbi:hypothetical protein TanjilG_31043 [Lupinus angustifolius]|uniref:UBA domain-containing protein n=1 Tax=Lupinus angustifolius TaxID=3871 RepID=A0A394DE33_LUPAN|nr:hypothetical protein TanjilG_31043 [Lupinus angustifolius]